MSDVLRNGYDVGCRNGNACKFIHDPSVTKDVQRDSASKDAPRHNEQNVQPGGATSSTGPNSKNEGGPVDGQSQRRFKNRPVPQDRVVPKPIPNKEPRRFEIDQIRRRFSAREVESSEHGSTDLHFNLMPSDPDFPFDLPRGLACVLHIPGSYLQTDISTQAVPRLDVKNSEMNRGFQLNVERGFSKIVERRPGAGILGWMKDFDKALEGLLIEQQAELITFVPNVRTATRVIPADRRNAAVETTATRPPQKAPLSKPKEEIAASYTESQLREASARRQGETSQLEARMGRLPQFELKSDSKVTHYTVPINPRKGAELPVPLQSLKVIKLSIPASYPLAHCTIELIDVARSAARKTESAFERKAREDGRDINLLGLINWLAQTIHILATGPDPEPVPEPESALVEGTEQTQTPIIETEDRHDLQSQGKTGTADNSLEQKSHIIIVPRPPEWEVGLDDEASSASSGSGDEFTDRDEDFEDHKHTGTAEPTTSSSSTAPERGVSLNFPQFELRNIELLELVIINITVKCERCKTATDIVNVRGIKASEIANPTSSEKAHTEFCRKCALPLSITYRPEFMHPTSQRAGYLDLSSCAPVDLLPSTFLPTCSSCSTTVPAPGITAVRGPTPTTSICRECHTHISFTLPQLKFLLASTNPFYNKATAFARAGGPKKKENLGITTGTELPSRGRCKHYSKSYRWFRFSCCSKVFPCDKCHDNDSDHPNEHANRMICGFCSREQNYRPEDCGICRMSMVKKAGRGFWEGGKGTRDRVKMSRKGKVFFSHMVNSLFPSVVHSFVCLHVILLHRLTLTSRTRSAEVQTSWRRRCFRQQ